MVENFRRPITAHDVAKLAEVSQSAVSRTFTKGASVSCKTREKVEAAAAALGYRPNFIARSLITNRSGQIAVVVPSLENPFYAAAVEALSKALESISYRVLLFSTVNNEDSDPVLDEVLRHRVDAVVMVSSSLSSRFAEECQQTGLPVVLLNRKNDNNTISSVTSDNLLGGELIASFLVAGGHTRMAFIAGNEGSSTSRDRELSFSASLAHRGMPAPLREVGHYTLQGAMEATRSLLSRAQPPDAIFCANDLMAIGALNVATTEFGLVPASTISIVGFDDIAPARWPLIGLTTYKQPLALMIEKAVQIIAAQLEETRKPSIQEVLPGRLIVRQSARRPRVGLMESEEGIYWVAP